MPEQRSRPKNGRVIALANQKGGTGKTTTTVNLGIGLARLGKKVLLIDADPQGDLTTCLGWQDQDSLQTTLATVMGKIIRDEPFTTDEGILHHSEGVDLMPANIELSELEVSLVNAMSREVTLRTYVNEAKKNYDVVLIDCMPSLGMITINALAAADSVIIPVQAHYLPAKGMTQLIKTIGKVKRQINPALKVDGVLLTLVDGRTNLARQTADTLRQSYGSVLKIYRSEIPVAIKAAEISAAGKSIYAYDKGSKVAQAYAEFSKEVLADGENNALTFKLPSADDLFSTEESRAEARLEKVINLNPSEISDFPNHPFKVRMDAAMQEMTESVKQYGVLVPALVRPKPDGGYEMVAGHRRKKAAELANLTEIPCIVRQLTDDEATIIMVDSNLQREQILPSEKAFAYKMKLDAMKRQGQRTDLTLSPVATKLDTAAQLGRQSGESRDQVFRFIRLTNLIPEILELVDNSVLKDPETLQIALRPAVELSYLRKEEQADLFAIMDELDCTPSHAQAIKMRQMSEAKTGGERLAKDALVSIMKEEKPNQKEQFKIPKERINKYFAPGTPAQKIEDTIIKALELYRKRQRSLER